MSAASTEELEAAAASTGNGVSVENYVQAMSCNDWGDNLMLVLLGRVFRTDISVISHNGEHGIARTFHADGREEPGVSTDAVWIVHDAEFHYYGVERSKYPVFVCHLPGNQARRRALGLVRDDCELSSVSSRKRRRPR